MIYHITPSHGYYQITLDQLITAIAKGFKCSAYSLITKTHKVLLEEDEDGPNYLKMLNYKPKIKKKYHEITEPNFCIYPTVEIIQNKIKEVTK